jgi:hypothetical protein
MVSYVSFTILRQEALADVAGLVNVLVSLSTNTGVTPRSTMDPLDEEDGFAPDGHEEASDDDDGDEVMDSDEGEMEEEQEEGADDEERFDNDDDEEDGEDGNQFDNGDDESSQGSDAASIWAEDEAGEDSQDAAQQAIMVCGLETANRILSGDHGTTSISRTELLSLHVRNHLLGPILGNAAPINNEPNAIREDGPATALLFDRFFPTRSRRKMWTGCSAPPSGPSPSSGSWRSSTARCRRRAWDGCARRRRGR